MKITTLIFAILFCSGVLANDDSISADKVILQKCLKGWGSHPFGENPEYKTIKAAVKVFGVGKNMLDEAQTEKPSLVLVKPAVNVLGKMKYQLMNPNGWYCLKNNTTVLAKTEIIAHCKAHLASASDGATVVGSNDEGHGVTVLGAIKVKHEGKGCSKNND